MPTVQPFSRAMIERFLDQNDLKYLRDQDGDFRLEFPYDDKRGCAISVWLIAAGEQDEIYQIVVLSDKHIPKSEWDTWIARCNQWNQQRRWPEAYLHVPDADSETAGVRLEENIDFEPGVHEELFQHFTNVVLGASAQFWEWANAPGER